MEFQVIRSKRKTMSLQMSDKGLIVRVPLRASNARINEFIFKHKAWIEKQLKAQEKKQAEIKKQGLLTQSDINELTMKAKEYIPKRVNHYAKIIGVQYGRITIRHQKSRWGSCSGKGNLNFNCLLMLTPPEVIDSVVVHELSHIKEMNHSRKFYNIVLKAFPDYRLWNKWLKKNGDTIMYRMIKGID